MELDLENKEKSAFLIITLLENKASMKNFRQ